MSQLLPEQISWEKALAGSKYFHVSGITPGLSASCAAETLRAIRAAKKLGATVSYDFNYRASLWTIDQAREAQRQFMEHVDILFCGVDLAGSLLGIDGHGSDRELAQAAASQFGFKSVVLTRRREVSAWKNTWSAISLHAGKVYESASYEAEVVDRIGGGDAFVGAYLAQLSNGVNEEAALKFATAYGALKLTLPGALCWATARDADEALSGGEMRVRR